MIRDDIKAATIAAMKGGDKETTGTLRLVSAAIKNRDIEARTGGAPKDDDTLVTEVLQKMVKQRRESADIYRKNGRDDRALVEEAEIAVIERFLPAQMSDADAQAAIQAIVAETGASSMKDMGRVMALVKERLGGAIEPARASALVKAALSIYSRQRGTDKKKAPPQRCGGAGIWSNECLPCGGGTPSAGGIGTAEAGHAVHRQRVENHHHRRCERGGHGELQIGRDRIELRADCRDVGERSADDRQRDDRRRCQHHSFHRQRDAGDQAEHDEHQGNVHFAEDDKPGDHCEHYVERAGKPADLVQHDFPPLIDPASGLMPPCVGTVTIYPRSSCVAALIIHARKSARSPVDKFFERVAREAPAIRDGSVTLSPAWLDELRARTTLSAVITPTVKLIRAGREWKACCPFHNEKTPSFTVNDDKGFYHCFGCGAHGDAIRFLTDRRGMPFMDAVKELAAKAGLEIPAPDPQAKERAERASSLTDVMGEVAKYYTEQLQGLGGADARDYLKRRGIEQETIARFGLGLAPDNRTALRKALERLGEDRLIETGMLIQPEESGKEPYDRFRGRLMIPVRDPRGRVIAFGGRILGDGEPKYLNSPDTPLFDKGRTLYNIDRASPASRTARRLIVVEGYMDVIALDRAGIAEVVAPNGTAVTEAQLERMWRLDPRRSCASTATAPGARPRSAPPCAPCPSSVPSARCASSSFRPARTPTMSSAPAGGTRSRLCCQPRAARCPAVAPEAESEPLTTPEARAGLQASA